MSTASDEEITKRVNQSIEYRLMAIDFKDCLINRSRYFIIHPFMDLLNTYINLAYTDSSGPFEEIQVNPGATLFRARICDENFIDPNRSRIKTVDYSFNNEKYIHKRNVENEKGLVNFFGYNAKDSCIPPLADGVTDGRVNPKYIRYLYTAETEYTALSEVRPILDSYVSIATIRVLKELTLLDIKPIQLYEDQKYVDFSSIINDFFSTPCTGELKDYLPSQYIAEYIKSIRGEHKYDGIRFSSSLDRTGSNVVIFYPEKCVAESSKIYQVGKINFEADCVSPISDYTILNSGNT